MRCSLPIKCLTLPAPKAVPASLPDSALHSHPGLVEPGGGSFCNMEKRQGGGHCRKRAASAASRQATATAQRRRTTGRARSAFLTTCRQLQGAGRPATYDSLSHSPAAMRHSLSPCLACRALPVQMLSYGWMRWVCCFGGSGLDICVGTHTAAQQRANTRP